MKLYLDTEFNGYNGQLISMALVHEDADRAPFYEVLGPLEYPTSWVKANVLPVLGDVSALTVPQFQSKLRSFMQSVDYGFIIADHPADFKYFCEIIDLDRGAVLGIPGFSLHLHGELPANHKPSLPHNALADAQALRRNYQDWITGVIAEVSR